MGQPIGHVPTRRCVDRRLPYRRRRGYAWRRNVPLAVVVAMRAAFAAWPKLHANNRAIDVVRVFGIVMPHVQVWQQLQPQHPTEQRRPCHNHAHPRILRAKPATLCERYGYRLGNTSDLSTQLAASVKTP